MHCFFTPCGTPPLWSQVTDDMKSKNRTDRGGVVAAAGKPPAGSKGGPTAPAAPPVLTLEQGRKWRIENQQGNREIAIDATMLQTAYIFNCHNSVVQVRGSRGGVPGFVLGVSRCILRF